VTVSGAGSLCLLGSYAHTCSVVFYKWNPEAREFTHQADLLFPLAGEIKRWESVTTYEGLGLLVFSLKKSTDCPGEQGLYFSTLNNEDILSSYVPILTQSDIVDFTLVHNPKSVNTLLFVVTAKKASYLKVYVWMPGSNEFLPDKEFFMGSTMVNIQAVPGVNYMTLMIKTEDAILFARLFEHGMKVGLLGQVNFYSDLGTRMALFENYGSVYGVVQERGTNVTLIKPHHSVQVITKPKLN